MFRTYDDWISTNPADEEPDFRCSGCADQTCPDCDGLPDEDEREERERTQRIRWAIESARYCPALPMIDDSLPF